MAEPWYAIPEGKTVPKLQRPVLLEGLPGIGNVGKIAIDFLIEELKAKKLSSLFSHTLPHSVFVNENNLVELPSIEVYYKQFSDRKKPDLLILTGDVQPTEEVSSYAFCEKVLELAKGFGVNEVITTGGIGLREVPEEPRIFITGNSKTLIERYAKKNAVETSIHGVVGPIVGVSGLLLGLASRYGMEGVALLAETFGHPMYLGVKGAREILRVLNGQWGLKLDLLKLTKEIEQLEKETIKRTKELTAMQRAMKGNSDETTYIG